MRTRDFWTVLIFVAIAAVAACGCVGRAGSDTDARTPRAVRLVIVEASTDAESTTYSAVIAPNAQVDLAFRVPGYVVDVRRTKGADGPDPCRGARRGRDNRTCSRPRSADRLSDRR